MLLPGALQQTKVKATDLHPPEITLLLAMPAFHPSRPPGRLAPK